MWRLCSNTVVQRPLNKNLIVPLTVSPLTWVKMSLFCNVCVSVLKCMYSVHLGWEYGLRVCVGHRESGGGGGSLREAGCHAAVSLLNHLPTPPGQNMSHWLPRCVEILSQGIMVSYLFIAPKAISTILFLHFKYSGLNKQQLHLKKTSVVIM